MDHEQLGVFYLGTTFDPATRTSTGEPVMYDARDLTTHAVCVGMTGSGKTGLCLAMIEEALIDGVPVIAIDPKGDLGNLMLTFPALAPADFAPWIDPGQAQRDGLTVDELAAKTAAKWRDGLTASGQSAGRIARLRAAGEVAIYTPGGDAGIPLSVLKSFRPPPAVLADDGEAWRDRVEGAVSGLLGLVGIAADPLRSREHVLLSTLLDQAWRDGKDLKLATLIQRVVKPPFSQVGAFDLETFFPAADRTALALTLNTLLASPSFAAWTTGAPLDIPDLLFTPAGKPRAAVLSIAHLGDAERMFFVTLLLQEVITWMRTQAGTSSLRAIVFMDEVAGYLPPTATPPSKKPMLTLLKQARAYGIGMVLATQNPVDVDYKALSNAGTWFLGRLQTERDKARVIEGLEGARAAAGKPFDRAAMEATLAGLTSRVFVMNNVHGTLHDDQPVVFQSRFVMSYLAGPLTRTQIKTLMAPVKGAATVATPARPATALGVGQRTVAPGGIEELFAPGATLGPALLGVVKVHYAQAKHEIDIWRELTVVARLDADTAGDFWQHAVVVDPARLVAGTPAPDEGAQFASLPAALDARTVGKLDDGLAAWVYRDAPLTPGGQELDLVSQPGETEPAFRARLAIKLRETRDAAVDSCRTVSAEARRGVRQARTAEHGSQRASAGESATTAPRSRSRVRARGAVRGRRSAAGKSPLPRAACHAPHPARDFARARVGRAARAATRRGRRRARRGRRGVAPRASPRAGGDRAQGEEGRHRDHAPRAAVAADRVRTWRCRLFRMAPRRGLPAVALALAAWTACKGDADKPADKPAGANLDARCERLAKACGDKPKHLDKITAECKQAAVKQLDKGCIDRVTIVYDCYEQELCSKGDRVWAVDDLRVLSDRHSRCVAERAALRACVGE